MADVCNALNGDRLAMQFMDEEQLRWSGPMRIAFCLDWYRIDYGCWLHWFKLSQGEITALMTDYLERQ